MKKVDCRKKRTKMPAEMTRRLKVVPNAELLTVSGAD